MATTIKEVALKANVSIATVSRVLNNDPRVAKQTYDRILHIANQLNYKPNILARNFVKKKTNLIGLILPEIIDEFFTEIIKGVDEVLYKNGFYTIVASSHKYRSLKEELLTFTNNGLISGLILLAPELKSKVKDVLNQSTIPIVLINPDPELKNFDKISPDNYKGAYEMTKYLIVKKKYSYLVHITGPVKNNDSQLRKKGFIDACRKYRVQHRVEKGNFSKESGYNCCKKILSEKVKPQVIFAGNDMMAIGCYDYIQKAGLKIPQDIGVAGFDDIFVSQYLSPSLTTVRINIEDIGKRAADTLIQRINNEIKSDNVSYKASSELVIRESC